MPHYLRTYAKSKKTAETYTTATYDADNCAVEGEDVYDSSGVRRDCCPGLVDTLEDRDPSDPLIGTYPKIIVCRPSRRNLRGTA